MYSWYGNHKCNRARFNIKFIHDYITKCIHCLITKESNDFITNCNYDLNIKCNNEFITKGNQNLNIK